LLLKKFYEKILL